MENLITGADLIKKKLKNYYEENLKFQDSFISTADLEYLKGRTQNHKEGSLEKVVENLVKTWEMEAGLNI